MTARNGWTDRLLKQVVALIKAGDQNSLQFSSSALAPSTSPAIVNGPAQHYNTATGFAYNWDINTQAWVAVPKVYRTLLTQAGTAAPVATVLENTLGDVVWSRTAQGDYRLTLAEAFPVGKTFHYVNPIYMNGDTVGDAPPVFNQLFHLNANFVQIVTGNMDQTLLDGYLFNTSFELLVYP